MRLHRVDSQPQRLAFFVRKILPHMQLLPWKHHRRLLVSELLLQANLFVLALVRDLEVPLLEHVVVGRFDRQLGVEALILFVDCVVVI